MPSNFSRLNSEIVALPTSEGNLWKHGPAEKGCGVRQGLQSTYICWLAFLGLLIFATSALAAVSGAGSNVSGAITENTRWTVANNPYVLNGDVVIQNGAILAIDAGAIVYMGANSSLTVQAGSIQAIGTTANPIRVLSEKTRLGQTAAPGDWRQWAFGPGAVNTQLDYVEFAHGRGLAVQGSSPVFNYLNVHDHQGPAITLDLAASPTGVGNRAKDNSLDGISIPAGDIQGSVTWGIRGIPYVVSSGTVSVGVSPVIGSITPLVIQQSQTIDAVISGARLSGAESIKFDSAGVSATLNGIGSDTSISVKVSASGAQPLGKIPFNVITAAGTARYADGITVVPSKPAIALGTITPVSLRREETQHFQVSGSSLLGAQVTVPTGVGLTLANLQTTDIQASFDLTASATATLGSQLITVTNPALANGVASLPVTIVEALPKINTNAIPMIVLPDGVARPYALSLSNADTVNHILNLGTLDSTIVSVSPASVTIPAGSTSVTINIAGLRLGVTSLNISSPTLAPTSKQIYATNLPNGSVVGPVLSPAVGVVVPYTPATALPVGSTVPVISAPVGVNVPYSLSSVLPAGTVVPVTSAAVGVNVPYSLSTTLPAGSVVPVISAPVGVNVPYSLSSVLPVGSVVPVTSATVGVNVPYSLSTALPVGTLVPVASPLVGVNVPYTLSNLPSGGVIGPVLSSPVGVDKP